MRPSLALLALTALLLASAVAGRKEDASGHGVDDPTNPGGGTVTPTPTPRTCTAGEDGCAKCNSKGTRCKGCLAVPGTTGLFVDAAGVCQPCPDAGCATCNKGGRCRACLPGLALSRSKTCSACGEGFVVAKNGRCKACPKNCKTCTKSSKCATCIDGVPNRGGKCRKPVEDNPHPENPETETPGRR